MALFPSATFHLTYPRTVRIWDVAAGALVRRFNYPGGAPMNVAFSPDGKTLAIGDGADQTVYLMETAIGQVRGHLPCPRAEPEDMAFTANGRALSWSFENSVRLTGVASGKDLCRFTGHADVAEMASTTDGVLATRSRRHRDRLVARPPVAEEPGTPVIHPPRCGEP